MVKFRLPGLMRSLPKAAATSHGKAGSSHDRKEGSMSLRRSLAGTHSSFSALLNRGGTARRPTATAGAPAGGVTADTTTTPAKKTGERAQELVDQIVSRTADVLDSADENGLGIDETAGSQPVQALVQQNRAEVVAACAELSRLMQGPEQTVRWMVWGFMDVMALQVLHGFGIPSLVPANGTIGLAQLAEASSLDAINLARLLRYAMTAGLFAEPAPGQITHSAASRALAQDARLADWVGFNTQEVFPASAMVLRALREFPEATSPRRTGFQLAQGTVDQETLFQTLGKDPSRARRMGGAMASLTAGEGYEVSHLVHGCFDFDKLNADGATLVDVGGSHGFVSVALARRYRRMKFIVQDLEKTVESAPSPICEDGQVAERVTLEAHDFFTEQKVRGADVYLFRWIMHNYSTPLAVKILRALTPALKPGSRVLINDHCVRPPGTEQADTERRLRGMDLVMLTLLNAQERDEAEYRELFAAADDGFVFQKVHRSYGNRMAVIEAVWKPHLVPIPPQSNRDSGNQGGGGDGGGGDGGG